MFLRKFCQQPKSQMRIFPAVFELWKFFINNAKGWEVRKKGVFLKGEKRVRKYLAECNGKFYHFKHVTLETIMVAKGGIQ